LIATGLNGAARADSIGDEGAQHSALAGADRLTIAFPFAGGAVGGSHISAVKLLKGLDRARFNPLVLVHRSIGPTIDLLESEGIAHEPAPLSEFFDPAAPDRLQQLVAIPRQTFQLARFLQRRGVRIVHTNDGPMHATWALPARLAGADLVWHHRGNPRAAGLRFLAPWLASRVVSVSQFASPLPGIISAANRCTVVHSPFDTDVALPTDAAARRVSAELAEAGIPANARLLGFFGHFISRKRPVEFVEMVSIIAAERPDLNVYGLMFGEALDADLYAGILNRAAKLGITDRIRIMGFRTPPEPWLKASEVMVVTAVDEPYGRTIIEAMLLGTPVVAAASGGNVEAIRHLETGVLVPADQPGAFAEAVIALLDEPAAAAAIAAAARTDALRRYGIDGHVKAISDIYTELVA
jgi:glycosyltransferase involved in cell wall biosynthesis